MSRTPTMAEVILAAIESRLMEVHTGIPAKVTRYDAAKQLIDAAPLIKTRFFNENGESIVEALPVVTNVPVIFPGSGNFGMTFPVAVGETVWLAFSEASLDKWKSQGGTVDPLDPRKHALADAVAMVGLRPFSSPFGGDSQYIMIGSKNGVADFVAVATKVQNELNALRTAFLNHGHNVTTAGSPAAQVGTTGTPGTALPVPAPVPPLVPMVVAAVGSVGSATVKIKG